MCYNYKYDGFGRLLGVSINGEDCVSYTYTKEKDANGNLLSSTKTAQKANGDTVTTVTDGRGRTASVTCNADAIKSGFTYDSYDRCTGYTEALTNGTTRQHSFGHSDKYYSHKVGNVTYELFKDDKYRTARKRHAFGTSSSRQYCYTYEDTFEGKLKSTTCDTWEQSYTYDKLGRMVGIKLKNDGKTVGSAKRTYLKHGDHATNLINGMSYLDGNGNRIAEQYTYNAAGHVEAVSENGKLKARYTYDKLDRLIREDNKALNTTTVFLYDNGGNILVQREYAYGLDDEDKLELQQTLSYGYSNEARPDQLTSFNGEAITYNTDGTPAVYRGLNCTFTRGKLTAIGGNTFVYDASGLRVKKNDTTYTYLEGKLLREQGPDGTLDFLYGADGVMGFVYNGETYFYRKNLFGDVTHIYDADGLLVASYVYDAWGNHTIKNEDDFDEIGNVNPIRYRGYYYDDELGLYYLRARYYDPDTGRFISQDSIDYIDPEHLMGLNLYAYCGNDSVMNRDPSGHSLESLWDGVCNWASDTWDGVCEWAGDTWDTVSDWAVDAWDSTCEWVSENANAILGITLTGLSIVAGIMTLGSTATVSGLLLGMAFGGGFGALNAAMNGDDLAFGTVSGMFTGLMGSISLPAAVFSAAGMSFLGDSVNGRKEVISSALRAGVAATTAGVFSSVGNKATEFLVGGVTEKYAIALIEAHFGFFFSTYNFIADAIVGLFQ